MPSAWSKFNFHISNEGLSDFIIRKMDCVDNTIWYHLKYYRTYDMEVTGFSRHCQSCFDAEEEKEPRDWLVERYIMGVTFDGLIHEFKEENFVCDECSCEWLATIMEKGIVVREKDILKSECDCSDKK